MRPVQIPDYIRTFMEIDKFDPKTHAAIGTAYKKLRGETNIPEISVVIPAYNEENNIVQTLGSLCNNICSRSVEIIVVDNNSADRTGEIVRACGVTCVKEMNQGITNARNAGLNVAKGKYVLNADADSIYPEKWIELMSEPLEQNNIAITYGRFSFIPIGNIGRKTYFLYEYIADASRTLNKYIKDEAVNVYGFNSAFRKADALLVDKFNHPPGTNEDGWLALKLRNKGLGRLYCVKDIRALVWTTDRRVQLDGGLIRGLNKRIKRIIFRK